MASLIEAALAALIEQHAGLPANEAAQPAPAADAEAPPALASEASILNTNELARIVGRDEFFAELARDEIDHLLSESTQRAFSPGQVVIERGATGTSMFIMRKGYVEVWVGHGAGDREEVAVAKLQPGDFFGEMSLLTGAPRTATIRALTSVVVEEVTKDSFRALLHKRPELLGIMSRIIAERRLRLKLAQEDGRAKPREEQTTGFAGQILARMRSFFGN